MRNDKGITMVTLAVTVIILIIISSVTITMSIRQFKAKELKDFNNDLENIQDKVDLYYTKNGELPATILYSGSMNFKTSKITPVNPNDNDDYYVVDLKKFDALTLNSRVVIDNPVFIVNELSHTVYYPSGYEDEGRIYYCIRTEYGQLNNVKEISFKTDKSGWTKENVTVTISATLSSGQKLQYSLNGTDWNDGTSVEVSENNQVIHARIISESDEEISTKKFEVTNIDKTEPTGEITLTNNTTGYKAEIKCSDSNGSGLDFDRCKYVLKDTSDLLGTNLEQYTDGNINSENETITRDCDDGTYYMHILLIDKAGNKKEIVSNDSVTIQKTE